MNKKIDSIEKPSVQELPFPVEWIADDPRKVETILSAMPIDEQCRAVMQLKGKPRLDLLLLSPQAVQVTRALPPEEIYQMVKEIGDNDALPVLSMVSTDQLQYIFDLEWWKGDVYLPKRALKWLILLDQCDEPKIPEWFMTEEFDQKVLLMQSLIKVFKRDEMTDSFEGVEGWPYYTPDGVYEIFFRVEDEDTKPIINFLKLLRLEEEKFFYALLEAVIWYPVTPTVEKAYQWRRTRIMERGIPDWEEAYEIYSRMTPEAMKLPPPVLEDFPVNEEVPLAPQYALANADSSNFFGQSLLLMQDSGRLDAIRWELVCLANKIMVADRRDPANLENREEVMRKALGYINIGLELGAEEDSGKGMKLLQRVWMQSLFQVGYHRLMEVKSRAEDFLKANGEFVDRLLSSSDKEQLGALALRFPQLGDIVAGAEETMRWQDFESLEDVLKIETFLNRWTFFVRFAKHCLNLTRHKMDQFMEECTFPENEEDMDFLTWVTTALARHTLFGEISCEPLHTAAAKQFLEIIFPPAVFKDEPRRVHEDHIDSFRQKLLKIPMAWTEEDRANLQELFPEVVQNLEDQFALLDPRGEIEWKFVHGLCLKS